jgi:hypothetical protein
MTMSRISCSFCTNSNPPDAKFCNQCGSPLGLKPCPACEAVNEAAALACHQCGAVLEAAPAEAVTRSGEPSSAEAAVSFAGQMSPDADAMDTVAGHAPLAVAGSITTPPFTVDAAQDAPIHIPESFADRLERDAGPHAFERVEPRIAHPDDRGAPEAVTPYTRSAAVRSRGRAWRAPVALAAVVAIASVAYYAYERDIPGLDRLAELARGERHAEAPAPAERASQGLPRAAAASGAPAADASSQPGNDAQNASSPAPATTAPDTPAPESNPASAALVSVLPGAPGQPQVDAGSTQPAASSATPKARPSAAPARNNDETARQRTDAAGRSRWQAEADAIATQRLIARDLGTATGPPVNAAAAPLDRDAAATQRLIERDLGPFLHRNDRSLRGGTYPATQ